MLIESLQVWLLLYGYLNIGVRPWKAKFSNFSDFPTVVLIKNDIPHSKTAEPDLQDGLAEVSPQCDAVSLGNRTHFPTNGSRSSTIDLILIKGELVSDSQSRLAGEIGPVLFECCSRVIGDRTRVYSDYKTTNWISFRPYVDLHISTVICLNSGEDIGAAIAHLVEVIHKAKSSLNVRSVSGRMGQTSRLDSVSDASSRLTTASVLVFLLRT